ncbi:MAG: hypothetical protein KBC84_11475, partial [Proteobacteria bacterium]|nr:hypothetical protein [Pseudomonadota bacterium]
LIDLVKADDVVVELKKIVSLFAEQIKEEHPTGVLLDLEVGEYESQHQEILDELTLAIICRKLINPVPNFSIYVNGDEFLNMNANLHVSAESFKAKIPLPLAALIEKFKIETLEDLLEFISSNQTFYAYYLYLYKVSIDNREMSELELLVGVEDIGDKKHLVIQDAEKRFPDDPQMLAKLEHFITACETEEIGPGSALLFSLSSRSRGHFSHLHDLVEFVSTIRKYMGMPANYILENIIGPIVSDISDYGGILSQELLELLECNDPRAWQILPIISTLIREFDINKILAYAETIKEGNNELTENLTLPAPLKKQGDALKSWFNMIRYWLIMTEVDYHLEQNGQSLDPFRRPSDSVDSD